jgi:glycerol-3-phosphate acyltransferase PlsX
MSIELPIAVDAMGGDYAPEEIIAGVAASGVPVILTGPERTLSEHLKNLDVPMQYGIVNAEQVVLNDDNPMSALRSKKDSSMMTAIQLVKEGRAAGVMSAGNTGAFMMGATMMLGRLPYVSHPAAAIPIPNTTDHSLLLDAGAATDSSASDLVNFAVMGSSYVHHIWGVENPRIGLLSIGEEEIKGSRSAKEAHQLLKASGLNFIGNVQGSDLGTTSVDVIVTDGFTGNVALKVAEGAATLIMEIVKKEIKRAGGIEKIAALALTPMMRRIRKHIDWQEYGGGALLGVRGNVVIAHGKSRKRAVSSAVKLAYELAKTDLLRRLEDSLREYHEAKNEVDGKGDGNGETKKE